MEVYIYTSGEPTNCTFAASGELAEWGSMFGLNAIIGYSYISQPLLPGPHAASSRLGSMTGAF